MMLRFDIGINVMQLYNGRRSFYGHLKIGRRTWFVSRWDTDRVTLKPGSIDLWRGPVMTWYAGTWIV